MGLLQHATSRVRYNADAPPPLMPKDPFDPEIFNRRYFGAQPARAAEPPVK
jgi:hypothetical protein